MPESRLGFQPGMGAAVARLLPLSKG